MGGKGDIPNVESITQGVSGVMPRQRVSLVATLLLPLSQPKVINSGLRLSSTVSGHQSKHRLLKSQIQ